jgi:predicted negative regulator of RcsB-dependent stress response
MPEGMNVEVAHKLSEHEKADRAKRRWEEVVEVLEVLVLAIAAIATAWSGYQAARGDGRQSVL